MKDNTVENPMAQGFQKPFKDPNDPKIVRSEQVERLRQENLLRQSGETPQSDEQPTQMPQQTQIEIGDPNNHEQVEEVKTSVAPKKTTRKKKTKTSDDDSKANPEKQEHENS